MRRRGRARAVALAGAIALAVGGCSAPVGRDPGAPGTPMPSIAATVEPVLPAAPSGTLYAARVTIDYDSRTGPGEASTSVFAADGQVDFDTRTGTMRSTGQTIGDWSPTGRIELDPRVTTSGSFLGLPYPPTSAPSAELSPEEYDIARGVLEWDIAMGLREMGFTSVPVFSGQRWVSYLNGPDAGSAGDGEQEYTQTRTLDVAPDGAWTYTTVTYYEGDHVAINRVLLDANRPVEPPVDAVRDLLRADPRYTQASLT